MVSRFYIGRIAVLNVDDGPIVLQGFGTFRCQTVGPAFQTQRRLRDQRSIVWLCENGYSLSVNIGTGVVEGSEETEGNREGGNVREREKKEGEKKRNPV